MLVVAGVWLWLARDLPMGGAAGPGPGFVPVLLAGLLALLGGLLLLPAAAPPGGWRAHGPPWGQAGLVIGLLALYVAALSYLGYFTATLPFVALAMWRCGVRSLLLLAGATVGLTFGVWGVLGVLFGVPLPHALWL